MKALIWAAVFSGLAALVGILGWLSGQNGVGGALAAGLSSVAAILMVVKGVQRARSERVESTTPGRGSQSTLLIAVQEQERRKLSRELHDGVGQILTAIKMELANVRAANGSDEERLGRVRAHVESAVRMVRNVSLLLRPSVLDDFGLVAALKWLTEDFSRRTGIECPFRCDIRDEQLLEDSVKTCIYRTVQEALHNCEKHAAATSTRVDVAQYAGQIQVSVTDNGRGILNLDSQSHGLGIVGMRERAQALGGNLEVRSNAGAGTRVRLLIPDGN
jgi:signal transduction histidine kinase